MTRKLIRLAKDLTFDLASDDVLNDGFRCQITGESGSGKSSTAASITAQAVGQRVQMIVLDIHGEYAPLAAAGPKTTLIGYRSTQSEPLYCTKKSIEGYLARIERGESVFFNLSEWAALTPATLDRFLVGDVGRNGKTDDPIEIGLLNGLFALRMRNPRLCILLAEEVQNIAPLQPLAGEAEKIRIFISLLTGGRKFGIQSVICTQAPALVNARARGANNVRIYLRISDANDWRNGIKQYIPDSLGVCYDRPKRAVEGEPVHLIRDFASGQAIVLSRWHEDQIVQLDRPTIAPNKTVPSVLA